MAGFTYDTPTELTQELNQLGELDNWAPDILAEGGRILKEAIVKELDAVIGYTTLARLQNRDFPSGELRRSVTLTRARKHKNGVWSISIRFRGDDPVTGVSNHDKAFYLNYGTRRQPARPFMSVALTKSKNEIENAMREKFNRLIIWNKITGG